MTTNKYGVEEAQAILSVLAKILSRGLAPDQRRMVLRSSHVQLEGIADEFAIYLALIQTLKSSGNLEFAMELTRRIEGTRSFYQDVGPDLDRLRYLVGTMERAVRAQTPYVFALLPFKESHFVTYEMAVKPVLEELGCVVEHAEEANTVDRIVDTILSKIARAAFLVADTTGKNPNVFYEIGYAHALGKKVILLVQDTADIPFDIAGLRHIRYKPQATNALKSELRKAIQTLLGGENPSQ